MRNKQLVAMAASLSLGAGIFAAVPALAQGTQGAPQRAPATQQPATPAAHISDTQITAYAHAQKKVQGVIKKWQGKVKNAGDPKVAAQYRQKANKEMVAAVTGTGLSVSDYNKISRAANSDPSVAKRIQQAR